MIKNAWKYLLLSLIILLFALLIFISTSTTGLKLIITTIQHFSPGTLKIQSINGALNRKIIIRNITYKTDNISITAPKLTLKIQPLALLLNEIRIDSLQIDKLYLVHLAHQNVIDTKNIPPTFNLPITLNLTNTTIGKLFFQQDSKKHQINNIHFNALIKSNHITIHSLVVKNQKTHYLLQGKINLLPINLELQLKQQNIKKTIFAITINANGNWKKLLLNGQMALPAKITIQATINNLLTLPSWKIKGKLSAFNISQYSKQFPYTNLTGSLQGSGDNKSISLSAKLAPAQITAPGKMTLQINAKLLDQPEFKGILAWHNIIFSHLRKYNINSPTGRLTLQGKPNNYQLSSIFRLASKNLPNSLLQLQGTGNHTTINLKKIKINTLAGEIDGQGMIKWQPALRYQLKLAAQHLKPQQTWIDWYGDLSFNNQIDGNQQIFNDRLFNLKGKLRQQNITGKAKLQITKGKVTNAKAKLTMGKANVDLSLQNNQRLQAAWTINIPNLADSTPFGNGSLVTQGKLAIINSLPTTTGFISGKDLAWLNYQIGNFNTTFQVDLNKTKSSNIQLHASRLEFFNHKFKQLDLIANGNRLRHQLTLTASTNQETISSTAIGHYTNNSWHLTIPQFTLLSSDAPSWKLNNPFRIYYKSHHFQLNDFSWYSGKQSIKASLDWQDKILQQTKMNFHDVSLQLFNSLLPHTTNLHGKLNLQATYTKKKSTASGKIIAKLYNGKIYYPNNKKQQNLTINTGQLQAHLINKKLSGSLALILPNNNYLNISLSANPFSLIEGFNNKQLFKGSLRGHLSQLEFLQLFFPQLQSLNGELDTDLQWNGTLREPHLTGKLNLKNSNLTLPQQGLQIKNIVLSAQAAKNQLNYVIKANSGEGGLKVNGETYLQANYRTELQLTGHNATVFNTPQYQITASPKLAIMVSNHKIKLSGDLDIPSANINLRNYTNVTTLPNDITITKQQPNQKHSAWDNIHAKLKLTLGKKVHFQNNYLNAQLAGSLLLNDNSTDNTKANGELTINKGVFTVFGQTLNIENGKLLYLGGPTTNPGLDIKATKMLTTFVSTTQNNLTSPISSTAATLNNQTNLPLQQETIVVGVAVSNTLSEPHIILFSNQPGLSQADILSYLILGYPLDNASNQQAQALLRAVNALSASNSSAGNIVTKVKETFKLDQIGLQSDSFLNTESNTVEQNTSLILGKMLSPKLFVRYSIGLLQPINTLSSTYNFNKHWLVQTQTNSLGNGIDFIYSWEIN